MLAVKICEGEFFRSSKRGEICAPPHNYTNTLLSYVYNHKAHPSIEGVPIEEWLEYCSVNFPVMGSNPTSLGKVFPQKLFLVHMRCSVGFGRPVL